MNEWGSRHTAALTQTNVTLSGHRSSMPHFAPNCHAHALHPGTLFSRSKKERRNQKRQSHTQTGQGKMRAREEGRPEQAGIEERVSSAYSWAPAKCKE